jgi:methylenetetrahydrofolate dehydrogenase (NADP+)/methenyltetrahydrofolate cyclohydrolase
MSARIIDGKAHAERLTRATAAAVAELKAGPGLVPGLAVVLIGADPASEVYVRNKARQTVAAGMNSWEHKLPAETSQAELLGLIGRLNRDVAVHGILVQLPLPRHVDAGAVLDAVDPAKDVDGFHVVNAGRLARGQDALLPCTPVGCLLLAKAALGPLDGLEAVVVGRSNIVGKPAAQLLLRKNCTVTIAHSKTRDLAAVCRRAELLIAAVGRAEMIRGAWVKPGACVIDVGINRIAGNGGSARLVGDVAFAEAVEVAGAITPVPGGVGPMTIACLLRNTLLAACAQSGLPPPAV